MASDFRPSVIEKAIDVTFARETADFQAARSQAPGIKLVMMEIPSSSAYEKLAWLGAMAPVRQWIGEVDVDEVESYDYTIKNLDWQASVSISENDAEDDQTGVIQTSGRYLARRIATHPDTLGVDLLIKGDTTDAYDEVKFFSNVTGNRKFDNLLAGSGTSLAQLEKDLNSALVAMARFPDDKGQALNITGTVIICPVELQRDFQRLTMSQTDATASIQGVSNPYRGLVVIGSPLLSADDTGNWYLLSSDQIVKPLIFSKRQEVRNRMWNKPGTKTWIYTADYRGAGGYGLPHLAVKVVN